MRKVGAGVAMLTYPGSPGPVWARVGENVLSLAVLALDRGGRRRRERTMLVTATISGVTVLDVLCAAALTRRWQQAALTAHRKRIGVNVQT